MCSLHTFTHINLRKGWGVWTIFQAEEGVLYKVRKSLHLLKLFKMIFLSNFISLQYDNFVLMQERHYLKICVILFPINFDFLFQFWWATTKERNLVEMLRPAKDWEQAVSGDWQNKQSRISNNTVSKTTEFRKGPLPRINVSIVTRIKTC
jgi:hypothetical protein